VEEGRRPLQGGTRCLLQCEVASDVKNGGYKLGDEGKIARLAGRP
jgi:hypothetical protein